jgi:hypothetical protein
MPLSLLMRIIASPVAAVDGIVKIAAINHGICESTGIAKNADFVDCFSLIKRRASFALPLTAIVTGSPGRGFSGIIVYFISAETQVVLPIIKIKLKIINNVRFIIFFLNCFSLGQ